jgi:hypothetical protein
MKRLRPAARRKNSRVATALLTVARQIDRIALGVLVALSKAR